MNLLLLEPDELELARSDERARHIERVLRLGVGARMRAGVVGGAVGEAIVTDITSTFIVLKLELSQEPLPLAPVELLLGHPRPIVVRRLLRDLAALGLAAIHVVPTELGEKSYRQSNIWDAPDRFLREGASQGGTTRLPLLVRHDSLAAGIRALAGANASRFVLHVSGSLAPRRDSPAPLLTHALAQAETFPVSVGVGSERGWTAGELRLLEESGFSVSHLGGRVLRTETAAVIAVWSAITAANS